MADSAAFSLLPGLALLEISGPDSERFLQGQLTCDVVALNDRRWITGACCTAKGRMVANFVIARQGQQFWLRLPADQTDALRQHLSRYAVFFKTTLTDHSADWQVLGELPATLQPQRLDGPQPLLDDDAGLSLQWPDGRREYWRPAADVRSEARLTDDWHLADLQLGLIWVTSASREAWVPQHIHWQQQGGISFRKGCYTGQEIVARLQYLGKNKKQLLSLHSEQPQTFSPLQPLTDGDGRTCGEIAAWYGQQGLAIINGEAAPDQVFAAEIPLQTRQLSYTDDITD